jgi:hypothetical protein
MTVETLFPKNLDCGRSSPAIITLFTEEMKKNADIGG